MVTKLAQLLITEVSGVDDPANELPGFMVAKASSPPQAREIGPDGEWDVAAAEERIRKATGADTAPTPAYAGCFLQHDEEDAGSFGAYKFLVCDVVDGVVKVMPAAIRAASAHAASAGVPETDLAELGAAIASLEAAAGITGEAEETNAKTIVGKIRQLLWPMGRDEVDMTKDELTAELDARFDAFGEALVEKLAPKVEETEASVEDGGSEVSKAEEVEHETTTDAETEGETVEAAPALTIEDIQKSITEALAPYNEILEGILKRAEAVESALAISARKSLVGQESGEAEGEVEATPTVADAITKAFRRH